MCRAGELPGIEQLVPQGVRSLAALIVPSGETVTGVLIVGWDALEPPCDEPALSHLRLAAAVLMRTLTMWRDSRITLVSGETYDIRWRIVRRGNAYKVREAEVIGFEMTTFLNTLFQNYISENGGNPRTLVIALNR